MYTSLSFPDISHEQPAVITVRSLDVASISTALFRLGRFVFSFNEAILLLPFPRIASKAKPSTNWKHKERSKGRISHRDLGQLVYPIQWALLRTLKGSGAPTEECYMAQACTVMVLV